MVEILTPQGMEEMELNVKELFSNILPKKTKKTRVRRARGARGADGGGGERDSSTWSS